MNKQNRTPFEERALNALNLGSLMNQIFSKDTNSDLPLRNSFSTLIYQPKAKFSTSITKLFNAPSLIMPQKNATLPKDIETMYFKGKTIQKVLFQAISNKKKSFNNNPEYSNSNCNCNVNNANVNSNTHSNSNSNLINPQLSKTSIIIFSPKKNTKLPLINDTVVHTENNSNSNLNCDLSQNQSSQNERKPVVKENKTYTNGVHSHVLLSKITQNNLLNYKEGKFRGLIRDNYAIYDSYSESEEEEEHKTLIIHPQSTLLYVWNMIILLSTLYFILIMPYCLAFLNSGQLSLAIIELFTEVMYLLDIIIQFFIPFFRDSTQNEYNFNHKDIALNYLFSWLALDVIVSIPYCSIINFTLYSLKDISYLNKGIELIKIIKILKVLKIFFYSSDKLTHQISYIDYLLTSKLKRFIQFFFYFFILNHTLSCLWVFIGTLSYPNWIVHQNIQDNDNIDIYISAFYYTLASIYTIGYGDIRPTNINERYYNIALQSIGLFIYSYVISSMTSLLKKNKKELAFDDKLNLLETFKVDYKIGYKLNIKIRKHLQHSYKFNQNERVSFLQTLPNSLKYVLITYIYADLLKFKIFNNTNIDFKARVVLNMKPVWYSKGELIIKKGTYIDDMVFIKKGVIGIEYQYKSNIILVNKLRSGEHFGEIDMLLDNPSEFDMVIKSKHAELLLLSKENLIDIGQDFPSLFEKIRKKSLANYTSIMHIRKQKMRMIDLSIFDNDNDDDNDNDQSSSHYDSNNNLNTFTDFNNNYNEFIGFNYGNETDKHVNKGPNHLKDIIEEEVIENEDDNDEEKGKEKYNGNAGSNNDYNSNSNNKSDRQDNTKYDNTTKELISSSIIDNDTITDNNELQSNKTMKRSDVSNIGNTNQSNRNFIYLKDNKPSEADYHLNPRRSSQCLFRGLGLGTTSFSKPITPFNSSSKYNLRQQQRENNKSFAMLNNEGRKATIRGELLPKRKFSCSLKNIEPVNNVKVMKMQSSKIINKMRESSMTINEPSKFYGSVFDKWQLDKQVQRIDCLYNNMMILKRGKKRKITKQESE